MSYPSRRVLEAARKAAEAVPGCGGWGSGFQHGAALYGHANRFKLAKGNLLKTHPKLTEFSSWPFLHAESRVILSYGMDRCHGLNLAVVRLSSAESFTMSRPCNACMALIHQVGINEVYYTNYQGEVKCLL